MLKHYMHRMKAAEMAVKHNLSLSELMKAFNKAYDAVMKGSGGWVSTYLTPISDRYLEALWQEGLINIDGDRFTLSRDGFERAQYYLYPPKVKPVRPTAPALPATTPVPTSPRRRSLKSGEHLRVVLSALSDSLNHDRLVYADDLDLVVRAATGTPALAPAKVLKESANSGWNHIDTLDAYDFSDDSTRSAFTDALNACYAALGERLFP